jgi:HK97 family phage prohead protease
LCGFAVCEEVVAQPPPTSATASKTIITPGELNRFADIILSRYGIFAPGTFSVNVFQPLQHSILTIMSNQNNRPVNNSRLATVFSERLVPLYDGQPGLRGKVQVEIREPSPSGPAASRDGSRSASTPDTRPSSTLDFIVSDETLDRYNEVIVASGWKLDNYLRNPVFQNSHQYGDIIYTIGRALITEVRTMHGRKVLFQRVEFATEANPIAKIAYNLYKGKFLNAVSVGFIPMQWENGEPGHLWQRRYTEQELLEVSAVGIPANPNALALGLKAGALSKQQIRDLGALIHYALRPSFVKSTTEGRPRKPFEPQRRVTEKYLRLLKLAACVRELLKRI